MSKNSIEFSLSNSKQRDSWLNSGHRTLDADKNGDIQSKVGSRSSLYSFMHNNFLFLQKCSSEGQDAK